MQEIYENDIDNEEENEEYHKITFSQQWKAEMDYGQIFYAAKGSMENIYE